LKKRVPWFVLSIKTKSGEITKDRIEPWEANQAIAFRAVALEMSKMYKYWNHPWGLVMI
jgi:hypothetical protein